MVTSMLLFARQPYKQKHQYLIGQAGPRSGLSAVQKTGPANVVESSIKKQTSYKKSYKSQ